MNHSRGFLQVVMPIVTVSVAFQISLSQGTLSIGGRHVGDVVDGATLVPTGQTVKPAGRTLAFAGRPIDMTLSADASELYVKCLAGLVVVDADSMVVRQSLPFEKNVGGSMHGIAVSADGKHLYVTASGGTLYEGTRNDEGTWSWGRRMTLPGFDRGDSYPCGVTVCRDGTKAYVALSRNNSLAVVDLNAGTLASEVPVGVAPFDVILSPDEAVAYVSNWGGRRPSAGERVMKSTGTETIVDERGIPTSGTLSKIDLRSARVTSEIAVGLHPSDLIRSEDGSRLFVANANSDNVSVIDPAAFRVVQTIDVRPDSSLPFGSITNAVALGPDGKILYAANGGNNALAVVSLTDAALSRVRPAGFIPTGWFPTAVITGGRQIFVASAKGEGSRQADTVKGKWHVKRQRGTVSRIESPDPGRLAAYSEEVGRRSRLRVSLKEFAFTPGGSRRKPVPVPRRTGEPSVFKHVVYVVKENRTYDQLFGDMKKGNNDPRLCIYGREVTPNHHAIASQFALLDNYYCSGIVSADGHQWATQGITSDYQEKAWGTWTRSYDFGTDPLAFAPTDFLWDNALLHGRSFRNYGEFDLPAVVPDTATWFAYYDDFIHGRGKVGFTPSQPLEPLKRYSCARYPGWNLRIPDAVRIERFMEEFREYEKRGDWPDLVFVYLPQDHTSGTAIDVPTPRAYVADNDLAVGKLVEAISRSRFWPSTCIFVNEDDPQDGFDHVDGHRSICLVASPYTKRGKVVSTFYNQSSVLHTIERILGLPPMNQLDALAPTMEDCFVSAPDFTPYTSLPNAIPLDEQNKLSSNVDGEAYRSQLLSKSMDFSVPDRIDDDQLNRILWFAAKGNEPYPVRYAGAHGRGLKALHLKSMKNDDE